MGAYKYLQELWKKKQSEVMQFVLRMRTWEYRQLPAIHRCAGPSRVEKARRLGYKAKQGYVVYRVRVRRGNRKRPAKKGVVCGKPKQIGIVGLKNAKNAKTIAEQAVGRKVKALRVLNSYWVAQDATFKYYEVICVDASHNAIRNDPKINWICADAHKRREARGLTSAGKQGRGLRAKGDKDNKARPSVRANQRRRNRKQLRRYR